MKSSSTRDATLLLDILNSQEEAILAEDPQGTILAVNDAFMDLVARGEPQASLIGETTLSRLDLATVLVHDADAFIRRVHEIRTAGVAVRDQLHLVDGRTFWRTFTPICRGGDTVFVWSYRDVTQLTAISERHEQVRDICTSVNNILNAFLSDMSPRDTFGAILDTALRVTKSEYGFVGEVFHDGADYLRTHAITNIAWDDSTRALYARQADEGFVFRNLDTLFGHVIRTGEVVVSNDPPSDARAGGTPKGHPPLRAFMGVPFLHQGRVVGMVGIANRSGGYDTHVQRLLDPLIAASTHTLLATRAERARRSAERGLERALLEAKRASAAKAEFLAAMSHDLRTPLHAVQGYLDIADQVADPATSDLIRCATRQTALLRTQIDRLLELAPASQGMEPLPAVPVDVHALLERIAGTLTRISDSGGVRFEFSASPHAPRWTRTDPDALRDLILLLGTNAAKASPAGQVVRIRGEVDDGQLIIDIIDRGEGLPPSLRDDPFSPFHPTAKHDRPQYGTGLARAYLTAQRLRGSLEVAETGSAGTTMRIRLPLDAVSPNEPTPNEVHPDPEFLPPWRVLVVDDHDDALEVAQVMLSGMGLEVDTASSGREALVRIATHRYDLALVDLDMPEMSGLELAARIHALEAALDHPPLHLVAMTAHVSSSWRQRSLEAGLTSWLPKPLTRRQLRDGVTEALAQSEFGLIDADLRPLATRYIGRQLERARQLRQASQATPDDLRSTAHQWKGTGGTYGLRMLRELSAHLEAEAERSDADAAAHTLRLIHSYLNVMLRYGQSQADESARS